MNENHPHALALYVMHYNFGRPHQTRTKANRGIKRTPGDGGGCGRSRLDARGSCDPARVYVKLHHY